MWLSTDPKRIEPALLETESVSASSLLPAVRPVPCAIHAGRLSDGSFPIATWSLQLRRLAGLLNNASTSPAVSVLRCCTAVDRLACSSALLDSALVANGLLAILVRRCASIGQYGEGSASREARYRPLCSYCTPPVCVCAGLSIAGSGARPRRRVGAPRSAQSHKVSVPAPSKAQGVLFEVRKGAQRRETGVLTCLTPGRFPSAGPA